jgi:ABC-type bacteriocin/lantibiotic exporter with double-glycine peptidase domain
MGIYTEVIRERDRIDRELVLNADIKMKNRHRNVLNKDDPAGSQLALNTILDKFGVTADKVFGYTDTIEMLDLMLDPLGILYSEIDLEDKAWKKRTDYILAFLEDGNAVALMPDIVGYKYICPVTGKKGHVTNKVILQNKAYVIQRPIMLKNVSLLSLAIYVIRLISARDVILIGAATLLVSILGLVTPKMNQFVLDDIVPMGTDGLGLLMHSLTIFLLAGVIRSGVSAAKTICLSNMRVRISSDMQAAVMSRVMLLPQTFFGKTSTGKLSKQIFNSRLLSEQIINFVMGASLTAVFSLVYIPQMASFSMVLLVPAIAILLIRCTVTILAGKFFAENEQDRQVAELENRSFMYSAFRGIQRIKESGAEKRVYAKWTGKYQAVLACDLDQPSLLKLEGVIGSFLTTLTTVTLLSLVIPNDIPKADYIAFNSSFALIVAAIDDLLDAQRKIYLMRPMMDQMKALLETPTENGCEEVVVRKLKGDIRVENIDFAYGDTKLGRLNDISIHISPGEKVALVGESGCGKSTLLKLILGVLKPDSGCIYIDNLPLNTLNLRSYRRNIGAVFQFSKVMPGTIYSNIAFCPHPVNLEEAVEALSRRA